MGSSAPSPPTPPDPVATASAQAQANAGTAAAQTALNNVNMNTPYGNSFFAQSGTASYTNPDGTVSTVPTYTEQQNLSAPEQKLFNEQNQLANQSNNAASLGLKSVNQTFQTPVTADNLPDLTTSLGQVPSLATGYDQGGQIQTSVPVQQAATTFGQTAQGIQGQIGSTQNGVQYFQPGDFTAARDAATNAALARLQPSMDQQNSQLQAQLANQGVGLGSSAYGAAMFNQAQANNDLRLGAVQTGDAEQQALFGEQATANQLFNAAQAQDFGQQQARGDFANAAQQQDYAQQQGRGQFQHQGAALNNASALAAGSFANSAQAQQNAENASAAAFGNSAAQGLFGMNQAAAAFGNQAREQSLSDQETINNNVVNQISALMHGGQVTAGQYQGYSPGQIGSTPISQDTYASANLAEQGYQTQAQIDAQNNSAMFSALGGLFGMGGKMMSGGIFGSDRRIKKGVVPLGSVPSGLPIYAFHYAWDDDDAPKHIGHMADEVAAVRPDAVLSHPDGFDMVDYGAL